MKKVYKWLLYIIPTIITMGMIIFCYGRYLEAKTHVVYPQSVELCKQLTIEGYIISVLCIFATVFCYIAIHKKFKNENLEVKHLKLKVVIISVAIPVLILLGISLLVMLYNH